jgi:glycosyltransferase involved in cell wall biosynthesis
MSDSPPLVSILIPAHRAAAYLGETLASVGAQTWPHWEVLVFEDGIYDNTSEIVYSFAAHSGHRVELLRSQDNLGVSRARNALLDAARGSSIAFLDADDTWTPDHLAHSLQLLRATRAEWVVGGANYIDQQGRITRRDVLPPVLPPARIPTSLLEHNFVLTGAVVADAAVFASGLRFDPSLKIGEDLDVWVRIVCAGRRTAFSKRATFNYRKHPVSTTADPVRFPEEFSVLFEKYLGQPEVDQLICRRLLRDMLLNVARMTWRRDPRRALASLHRLFRFNRWSPQAWAYCLLAHLRAGTTS